MPAAISVVVPVYNAEKYLRECVDSLLAQTFQDVEFIFVDDGSTDHSAEILEEYRQKDSRIRVLRQRNQYAGVARNNGMKIAMGKYLIFLDADDFFAPTLLEETFRCAEKNNAEIVVFSFQHYDNLTGRLTPFRKQNFPDTVFNVNQCGRTFFSDFYAGPCNKLYLRKFIEETGIRFQPVRKSEDTFFVMTTACCADRIVFLDQPLFFYRVNNSASSQGNVNIDRDAFLLARICVKAELQNRGLFVENVRASFFENAIAKIKDYYHKGERNAASLCEYYRSVKSHLTPEVFDSAADFSEDSFLTMLDQSNDFEDFLLMLLDAEEKRSKELAQTVKKLYETRVSKKNMSYRLGQLLLYVPRKITRFFTKKNL